MKDRWQEFRDNFTFSEPEPPSSAPSWPEPIAYSVFKKQVIEPPRPIIDSLLDVSSRMIFGGGSKTYKTWAMSDLALSTAAGSQWWGFDTVLTPCLYVNFELKDYYIQKRLRAIQNAKELDDGPLHIWNLRGYSITLGEFKAELVRLIEELKVLLVFIDPFYKLLMGRDERISAEINDILATFDEINRLTGATVIFSAHFTKGNQAGKDCLDRISGGGSINRDPDNLVTLTKHEEDHAFTVEFTLRDFAPIAPFVVRWEYPLLVRTDLDPEKLKIPRSRGRSTYQASDLIALIKAHDDELNSTQLCELADSELGWARATVMRKLAELRKKKQIYVSKITQNWNVEL